MHDNLLMCVCVPRLVVCASVSTHFKPCLVKVHCSLRGFHLQQKISHSQQIINVCVPRVVAIACTSLFFNIFQTLRGQSSVFVVSNVFVQR